MTSGRVSRAPWQDGQGWLLRYFTRSSRTNSIRSPDSGAPCWESPLERMTTMVGFAAAVAVFEVDGFPAAAVQDQAADSLRQILERGIHLEMKCRARTG